jgi:hypothetical protein
MKKTLIALLVFCFTPLAYAGYGSILFSDNKDEDNAIRMVYGVQTIYEKSPTFKHLEHIPLQKFWFSTYEPMAEDNLKNFELTTEEDNQVAVIKYQVKNCDSLKDVKEKLLDYKIIKHTDYVDCFNNQFVAEIKKEKLEDVEDLTQEDEQDDLAS